MFDHVTIRVADLEASTRFYRTVLAAIEVGPELEGETFSEWYDFSIAQASDERPATRNLHVGLVAPSRDHVDEFWQAGTEAGYQSDGEPGRRPEYGEDYYGGFLLDPDGNSVEAVHHDDLRHGHVDHLWIGVTDLLRAAEFYATTARFTGIRGGTESAERRQFRGAYGTFSLLADGRPATENLHIAFPAPDRQTVDDFHAAATAAGYRDEGAPGERPEYHRGYYAAFVLDPDGNNVELVHHGNR